MISSPHTNTNSQHLERLVKLLDNAMARHDVKAARNAAPRPPRAPILLDAAREAARLNPGVKPSKLAVMVGCSETTARQALLELKRKGENLR